MLLAPHHRQQLQEGAAFTVAPRFSGAQTLPVRSGISHVLGDERQPLWLTAKTHAEGILHALPRWRKTFWNHQDSTRTAFFKKARIHAQRDGMVYDMTIHQLVEQWDRDTVRSGFLWLIHRRAFWFKPPLDRL